jgi:hypothetical protein
MTPVYWPAGTLANVPRKKVSDCRRMRSTTGEPLSVKACCLPPEVIRAIPVTVTLKVKREGLAGSVSATMVKLTEPVPPPQLTVQTVPDLGPAQEEKVKEASESRKSRALLQFI